MESNNYAQDLIQVRRYSRMRTLGQDVLTPGGLEKTLRKGCAVLEDLGVKFWLSSATLMGLHRDGQFIPNDKDVDIDVYSDRDIYRILKALPFEIIVRIVSSNNRFMQFALFDEETKAIFDLFFFHPMGERLENRNDYGVFWYPADKLKTLTTIHFNGKDYPCPDPDWYCEFMYGKEWRTPKSYKGHWTEDYKKDCTGFIFTGNEGVEELNYF